MNETLLSVSNLYATLESGYAVLKGVDLTINKGEVHVIMGPNGSGKSTLANTIMGSPVYNITEGDIIFEGEDITASRVDERAKKGIFLAFQAPEEIDGITMFDFLRTAAVARSSEPVKFYPFKLQMDKTLQTLQLDETYSDRYLNVGFSGGEKKKSEILQMLTLQPKLAILDETDSGLDVDAVRVVTDGILQFKNAENALLIISHSTRLLDDLPIDRVHILVDGRFVHHGDKSLIQEINENGFARFLAKEA